MMVILHLAEYASGGVATYLRTLINLQLRNPDIDRIILMISDTKSEDFIFHSSKVRVIRYRYTRGVCGIIRLLHLWPMIKSFNPNVVHLHSTFAGLLRIRLLLTPRRNRIGVVYCSHGWSFNQHISSTTKRLYMAVERLLSHVGYIINISASEETSAKLAGISTNNMVMIYNTIEFSPASQVRHQAHPGIKYLFVGRFDPQKGLDVLLNAFSRLPNSYELLIVGGSVLKEYSDVNIPDQENIHQLGWLNHEQVSQQMQRVDAVIVPSRWEGFGLVALEAMSNKTAVIASKVGGLTEIVQPMETGLLVSPDSSNALYEAMKKVSKDGLEQMGRAGRLRLEEKFNPKQMEDKVYQLYVASVKG